MEQDVKENEVLLLRFKYHSFFDLNPKVCTADFTVHFQLINGVLADICWAHGAPESHVIAIKCPQRAPPGITPPLYQNVFVVSLKIKTIWKLEKK